MVFPSVPLFLDPPNWHQLSRPNDETQRAAQQALPAVAAATSMTERARVARIPASEEPLKCPRCDSSNTKFCYFNNYNLAQPRHFCKTCRRYWTRGGSLRNVPIGGGCRRNKRKRSSAGRRPKSPAAANPNLSQQPLDPALAEFVAQPSATQPFSFMASLHSLMTSQVGLGSFGGNNNNNNNSESQLPNLLGLGASNCYPFFQSNNDQSNNMEGIMETASFGRGLLGFQHGHLEPPVKMEESPGARVNLQLSKQFVTDDVRVSPYHQQQLFSSGNNNSTSHLGLWTDLSGIWSSSSSTTTPPTLNTIMR